MTEPNGLILNLDKRYPIGVRRLAVGHGIEEKIAREFRLNRRLRSFLIPLSIILCGISSGCFYNNPWNGEYMVATAVLSTTYTSLMGTIYVHARTIKRRYSSLYEKEYASSALKYIEQCTSVLKPDIPKYLNWLGSIKVFKDSLNYDRKLVAFQFLCGNLNNSELGVPAKHEIENFNCDAPAPRQVAMSVLNKYGSSVFVRKVFRAILSQSSKSDRQLSAIQISICAAKSELYKNEIIDLPPSERPEIVHRNVINEFGKCRTSVGQIEEDIAKNRHPSLDKILQQFERLHSP